MKKVFYVLMALVMVMASVAGCAAPAAEDTHTTAGLAQGLSDEGLQRGAMATDPGIQRIRHAAAHRRRG